MIKVVRSSEYRGVLLKGTIRKISKKGGLLKFFCSINKICFTINEKCTYNVR